MTAVDRPSVLTPDGDVSPTSTSTPIGATVSTHVLDAALGRPAAGIPVQLELEDHGLIHATVTDADGRVASLSPTPLTDGAYRLVFDTADYFAATGQTGFFPEVCITFQVLGADSASPHFHVPLLLSPYAYSTYRGS